MNQLNAFTEGDGSLEIGRGEDGTRVNSKTSAQTSIDTLDKALVQVMTTVHILDRSKTD